MCGIAGIVGRAPDTEQLKAMADAMIHRGPDDEGYYTGDGVGFAFRRLSIIDLDHGHQPMVSQDGRIAVVFNGEIYNHRELRQELEAKGHVFFTDHSDTEVFVHGFREWGTDLFPKLNGMFGVAIWDNDNRTLVLARDRYGVKPVYYAPLHDDAFAFGSEIRTILAANVTEKKPNPLGVMEYMNFQNLWGDRTMFHGINQLPAGTYLVYKAGRYSMRKFWDLSFTRSRTGTMDELAEEHRAIVRRGVKRQIAADVPVMSYLSGGIDSTSITIAAYEEDPSVRAYSCIFNLDNVGTDRASDEREFSRLVAEEYNLDRVEMEVSEDALMSCMDHYTESLEDLRMGMGYVNYLIAQRVAQDAKVVLSGTGGDEYHAGYVARYSILKLTEEQPYKGYSLAFNEDLGLMSSADRQRTYKNVLNAIFQPQQYASVFTPEFCEETKEFDAEGQMNDFLAKVPSQDWRDIVWYVDAKTYLAGLFAFEDKVSMAHSLETRVPLMDNELIDFVLDVPFERLAQGDKGKMLFRESVRPFVPEAIYNKPKMGFGPPDKSWYRNKLAPWIKDQLSEKNIKKQGVFKPEYVQWILDSHFSGASDYTYLIWTMLNFMSWSRNYGYYAP
ncbi:asparagine synthase (glutamine-hydrolyzing) [Hyphobacterium sp.]|uniref:asparagine synthase (glutamine-hydrolyzing) n=1 Tax=Hyphobacterium sp. TaxID=2004662 RepID=UPI003BACB929